MEKINKRLKRMIVYMFTLLLKVMEQKMGNLKRLDFICLFFLDLLVLMF